MVWGFHISWIKSTVTLSLALHLTTALNWSIWGEACFITSTPLSFSPFRHFWIWRAPGRCRQFRRRQSCLSKTGLPSQKRARCLIYFHSARYSTVLFFQLGTLPLVWPDITNRKLDLIIVSLVLVVQITIKVNCMHYGKYIIIIYAIGFLIAAYGS